MSISGISNIIEISDLNLCFEGQPLFQNFNFCVETGARIRITGPSGSGKSTLFKCILGLTMPDTGEIRIDGKVISRFTVYETRSRIAYVPQEPDPGTGTIRSFLETPFQYRMNQNRAANLNRIPELMDRFLLNGLDTNKPVDELSGGEKQRIAVISAILLDREIYLLDESTSALDADAKSTVTAYFAEQPDITVLAISHDPELAGFNGPVLELAARENGD